MPSNQLVFLGLGSNLGSRIAHLRWAIAQLQSDRETEVVAISPVYESAAHILPDTPAQPAYLNAVLSIRTNKTPLQLLACIHEIERGRGRRRDEALRWTSRTLDIDVLAFETFRLQSKALKIPHPRLHERKFVLAPWADIAPDFMVPAPFEATIESLLATCPDSAHIRKTRYRLRAT